LKEKKEFKIVLKDIEKVFEDLITFIYTGIASNKKKFAEKLLAASLLYDIKELKHLCQYFAFKELSHEKLDEVLSFCETYKTSKLREKVFNYMIKNYEELKESKEFDWNKFVTENRELAQQLFDTITRKIEDNPKTSHERIRTIHIFLG